MWTGLCFIKEAAQETASVIRFMVGEDSLCSVETLANLTQELRLFFPRLSNLCVVAE